MPKCFLWIFLVLAFSSATFATQVQDQEFGNIAENITENEGKSLARLQALLEKGYKPSSHMFNYDAYMALFGESGSYGAVRLLRGHGAITDPQRFVYYVLIGASNKGKLNFMRWLLDKNPDLPTLNQEEWNVIFYQAIMPGHVDVMAWLINSRYVDPTKFPDYFITCIFWSILQSESNSVYSSMIKILALCPQLTQSMIDEDFLQLVAWSNARSARYSRALERFSLCVWSGLPRPSQGAIDAGFRKAFTRDNLFLIDWFLNPKNGIHGPSQNVLESVLMQARRMSKDPTIGSRDRAFARHVVLHIADYIVKNQTLNVNNIHSNEPSTHTPWAPRSVEKERKTRRAAAVGSPMTAALPSAAMESKEPEDVFNTWPIAPYGSDNAVKYGNVDPLSPWGNVDDHGDRF